MDVDSVLLVDEHGTDNGVLVDGCWTTNGALLVDGHGSDEDVLLVDGPTADTVLSVVEIRISVIDSSTRFGMEANSKWEASSSNSSMIENDTGLVGIISESWLIIKSLFNSISEPSLGQHSGWCNFKRLT